MDADDSRSDSAVLDRRSQLVERLVELGKTQLMLSLELAEIDGVCLPRGQDHGHPNSMGGIRRGVPKARLLRVAELVYKARRERAKYFEADLFAEPAWDMLIDLFIAELTHREVRTTSLCIAADVPSTTALRYIRGLEDKGLIERRSDDRDGRLNVVSLTTTSYRKLLEYFERQVKRLGMEGIA